MITALSFTSRVVQAGAGWVLRALVVDEYGCPSADVPSVTIQESGTAEVGPFAMDATSCPGVFSLTHYPGFPGRAVATATHAAHGAVSWVADVRTVTDPDTGLPTVSTCNNYMGDHSWSDADVQDALDTEMSAQFGVCRIPAAYPADLRAAVHRRVQRNLSMRHLPLAVRESAGGDSIVVPGRDPEVRRLEGPYRKVPIG